MSRARSQEIKVFPSDGTFRVIRSTSRAKAELREKMGEWRREFAPSTGALLGFRLIAPEERRGEQDLPSTPSTAQIAPWEMELNAERSQTAHLDAERRSERQLEGKDDEDIVERVQAKVRVYVALGAAPGDILRVWPLRTARAIA